MKLIKKKLHFLQILACNRFASEDRCKTQGTLSYIFSNIVFGVAFSPTACCQLILSSFLLDCLTYSVDITFLKHRIYGCCIVLTIQQFVNIKNKLWVEKKPQASMYVSTVYLRCAASKKGLIIKRKFSVSVWEHYPVFKIIEKNT